MALHIYHYNTHSEKRYFLGREHHDLYDMIAFNGNIVSHTPQAIAAFIATTNKEFYIDPQTHAFQHSTINLKRDISDKEKGEPPSYKFKPSIVRLAKERLGGPFSAVIDKDRPISPSDFFNDNKEINMDIITEITHKVIEFQQNFLTNELDAEAKEFIEDENSLKPKFIIAPYFYLSSINFDSWIKINLTFYEKAKEIVKDIPVYFALVISKEVLNYLDKEILETIDRIKPDGILFWVDEYTEEDLGVREIQKLIVFLKKLKKLTSTIYNIHAGYLSILLCHSEIDNLLDGVGHSINYGENRSVIPVGGGIPMARFYLPMVHSRLRFGDALEVIRAQNWLSSVESYKNVCQCAYCMKLISENKSIDDAFMVYGESFTVKSRRRSGTIVSLEYPTKEAKQAAAYHYLYNKANEFSELSKFTLKEHIEKMIDSYNLLSNTVGDETVGHLYNWCTVINSDVDK